MINLISSKFIPWVESTTTKAIKDVSKEYIERLEAYLSICSFCFFLGTPAVSITLKILSSNITCSINESLVVPGMSETIDLSFFNNELNLSLIYNEVEKQGSCQKR